jgi:phosphatidylglycerol---prolipoprotein diacylglyceryl transferase
MASAVIPYFALRTIPIGAGVSLAVFGTLVAIGVVAGVVFAQRRARAAGIPEREIDLAILWAVVPGFLAAHLVAMMPRLAGHGWSAVTALQFWNGMSSFGGFAGAFLGLAFHYRRRGSRPWLPVADILVQALVVGWVFGRLNQTNERLFGDAGGADLILRGESQAKSIEHA